VNSIDQGRRVRAGYVNAASAVTVLLLPFVIHASWGYVEARRLDAAIRAIEARGEPVRTQLITPVGDAATAARYYRAAAALASDFRIDPGGWAGELAAAERTGNWPDALIATIRTAIAPYEEMLRLLDRAADLPVENFGPGATYNYPAESNYLARGLMQSSRISSLRAAVKAFDGDAAGAARSLHSALQAGLWFTRGGGSFSPAYIAWFGSALHISLQRVRPQDTELERLARALADADEDDVLTREFLGVRAGTLSRIPAHPSYIGTPVIPLFVVDRPWRTHQMNRQLAWYADVLTVVDAPWPERIDAVGTVAYFNLDAQRSREWMLKSIEYMVSRVAVVRSLRTAIAIERYRRAHAEQLPPGLSDLSPSYLPAPPIDPFTGQPILYLKMPNGYTVYSAGVNRRDDKGDVSAQWAGGADLGVAIRHF
jgi:hypothetical protein